MTKTAAQILRKKFPSTINRLRILADFKVEEMCTYPDEIEVCRRSFSSGGSEELRNFLKSIFVENFIRNGAEISLLQLSGTTVWVKYKKGSKGYSDHVRNAIKIKNEPKRKKIFFIRLFRQFFL